MQIAVLSAATTNADYDGDDYNDRDQGVHEDYHRDRSTSTSICIVYVRAFIAARVVFNFYTTGLVVVLRVL